MCINMVIQRNSKTLYDYHANNYGENNGESCGRAHDSTTEDAHSANQNQKGVNTGTSASYQPDENFITTMEMANDVLKVLKKRYLTFDDTLGTKTSNNNDFAFRALELLRMNIQNAFDKEIDVIVAKYLNLYIRPAFEKLKANLKTGYDNEEVLGVMKCALIENSKFQYNLIADNSDNFLLLNTHDIKENQSATKDKFTGATKNEMEIQTKNSLQKAGALKRSLGTVSDDSPSPVKKSVVMQKNTLSSGNNISQKLTTQRRQIYWHTANISTETYFVLDVQANQAFGFNPDGRERLASKYPELIRYLPDSQDRDWLVQQKIIPAQNRTSRFLLLVYEEVLKLGRSSLYKNRENFNLQHLQPFTISNVTIQKMKTFFIDLNIKSRGLITNSYTSNMLNNRAINESSNLSVTLINSKTNRCSQLRNALLQTNQRTQTEQRAEEEDNLILDIQPLQADSSAISSTASEISNFEEKNRLFVATKQSNPVLTSVFKSKDKSTLSSSHATLTALLNNNSFLKKDNCITYKNSEKLQPKST
ncbi:uncharacterized protein LOC129609022 [Condylostylus longicornis]|uniref:uncharacterized protein LOC129609022 n=1 Tax=Condylostylus longicornis TaxID=2530218 RepID=UPI00244DDEA9|nr:uncharacterized protein LOC129609022 [Condylostylus longicornis]